MQTIGEQECKACGHEKQWHWQASDHSLMCVARHPLSNEICKCRNFVE